MADGDLERPVPKHLVRKSTYSVEEVMSWKHLPRRLRVFQRDGVSCVKCRIVGTFFALEKHIKQNVDAPDKGWHYNLYADVPGGGTRLMTVDHIVPRSRGGSRRGMYNMQPMCYKCNGKKGNSMPGEIVPSGKDARKVVKNHRIISRSWKNYFKFLLSLSAWRRRLLWAWHRRRIPKLPKLPRTLEPR